MALLDISAVKTYNIKMLESRQNNSNQKENTFPTIKSCDVRVLKLHENKHYNKENVCPTVKLTKDEKSLLLDYKKTKRKAPATPKQKKTKEKGRFQMKITGFFTPPPSKTKSITSGSSSPDSGFASRAETPAIEEENGSPVKVDEDSENALQKEKDKFVEDLEADSEDEQESSSSESEDSEDDFDPNDSDDGGKKKGFNAKKPAKKVVARKKAVGGKSLVPTVLKSEMSEYEKIRAGNIQEREAMLAALMSDFANFKKDSGIGVAQKRPPTKKRKRVELNEDGDEVGFQAPREGSRKSARISAMPEDKDKLGSEITYKDPERRGLAEEESDYDEEEYQAYEDRVRKRAPRPGQIDPNEDVLMPEDVTQAMLNKICERFGEKTYNQTIGTSCHQCRQKTTDTKTICRSGKCVGVRGQFCGRCLEIRYGEDAREALLNPTWSCPPCRGFCNCSICRNRNGKGATGILIQIAQSKGFNNVASYLKSLTQKKGTDEFDSDDDEEPVKKKEKPKKKKAKETKESKDEISEVSNENKPDVSETVDADNETEQKNIECT